MADTKKPKAPKTDSADKKPANPAAKPAKAAKPVAKAPAKAPKATIPTKKDPVDQFLAMLAQLDGPEGVTFLENDKWKEALESSIGPTVEFVNTLILDSKFPVPIYFASYIPFHVYMQTAAVDLPENPTEQAQQELMVNCLNDALDTLLIEDMEVLESTLNETLETEELDTKPKKALKACLGLLRLGLAEEFVGSMLVACLGSGQFATLDFDSDVPEFKEPEEMTFSPAFLEKYGDLLAKNDLTGMALRTYRLIEALSGKVSAKLQKKIDKLVEEGAEEPRCSEDEGCCHCHDDDCDGCK